MRAALSTPKRLANPGGLLYRDARYLAAQIEIDPRAARRWLPGGLRCVPNCNSPC